jgi:hypothetical protein
MQRPARQRQPQRRPRGWQSRWSANASPLARPTVDLAADLAALSRRRACQRSGRVFCLVGGACRWRAGPWASLSLVGLLLNTVTTSLPNVKLQECVSLYRCERIDRGPSFWPKTPENCFGSCETWLRDLVCGNVRREISEAGIREPELTLQVLRGLGGVRGFLFVAGWALALIGGVLLAVFF